MSDFGFDGDDEWGIFDEEIDVLPFSFVQIVGGDADVSPTIFALHVLDLELAFSSGTWPTKKATLWFRTAGLLNIREFGSE